MTASSFPLWRSLLAALFLAQPLAATTISANFTSATTVYHFVADYYGGDGNDLVLQWAFRSAHAWGGNDYGQLGDSSTTLRRIPVAVHSFGDLAGKTPVSLAAGHGHSLALCADGTLAAWGNNLSGQLGINSAAMQSNVPVNITGMGALANKTVVAIAAGHSHSLALCSDGTIAAWGDNNHGQLGHASLGPRSAPTAVPAVVALAGKSAPNTREYDLLLARFPTLADPSPLADPDGDSITNLMESILGGDPSRPSTAILPVATRNGGVLTFTFLLRVDALMETALVFQSSPDLTHWTDIDLTVPASDPRVAIGSTTPQGLRPVTITLPASAAGNLFCRLMATASD